MPALPTAPGDVFQVDQDNLICIPARWTTVARFFVLNYAAHAFTIWSRPGEATIEKIFAMALAFFFPVSGLSRGIDAIYRHASFHCGHGLLKGLFGFGSNDYEIYKAARAGALAIVAREQIDRDHKHRQDASSSCFALNRENWQYATLRCIPPRPIGRVPSNTRDISPAYQIRVQGDHKVTMPEDLQRSREISGLTSQKNKSGYRVVELSSDWAKYIELPTKEYSKLHISQTSNLLATSIAVCQILYAAYELSRITGDQLDRFGYSAFSLTVIPYLVMSFVNLIGNLATPTYPSVYMIGTSILEEAKLRGIKFDGSVGYIEDGSLQDDHAATKRSLQTSEYSIRPYSCQNAAFWKTEPMHRSSGGTSQLYTALPICFDKGCQKSHRGSLQVPSGRPESKDGGFAEDFFKFGTLLVAVATHIAPIVYVGLNYGPPSRLDQKVAFPLWIAVGDAFGFLLLYYRVKASLLKETWRWFRQKCCCGYRLQPHEKQIQMHFSPVLRMIGIVVGIAVASWNFYIVGVQILAFGDCINVSNGM